MEVIERVAFSEGGAVGTGYENTGFRYVIPRFRSTPNNGLVSHFAFGTETPQDTLQALRVANRTALAEYGIDNAWSAITSLMNATNSVVGQMLESLNMADITVDRQRAYGSTSTMVMEELDINGTPRPQKVVAGITTGAPLRNYGVGVQFNWDFWQNATAQELVAQMQALITADATLVLRQLKRGILYSTNTTFRDDLVDGVDLYCKVFANGVDEGSYPSGQNGLAVPGTHNHYLGWGAAAWASATAAQRAADAILLVNHVKEHILDGNGAVNIYVNFADAKYWAGDGTGTIAAMAGFVPLPYQVVLPGINQDISRGMGRPTIPIYDVLIGTFQGCQVWVKPFTVAGYATAHAVGPNIDPALWIRVPSEPKALPGFSMPDIAGAVSLGGGNLHFVQNQPGYPYIVQAAQRRFGVSVWNRLAMASMHIANGSTGTYTPPTIN